jgi:hypothetical protein
MQVTLIFYLFYLEGHITRKLTLKNQKKSMDKKLGMAYVTKITFAHVWDVTSRNYRLTLHFFQISIDQNLAEADVKFGLVKFC